jgi:restriction system protein
MAIPDFQLLLFPVLKIAGDRQEHSLRETVEALAHQFGLTEEDRRELLPSGRQALFGNRAGWALTYLKKAGLLVSTRRGCYQITERGLEVLRQNPPAINASFLRRFPEFLEFQRPLRTGEGIAAEPEAGAKETPEEAIEAAYQRLRRSLEGELLHTICTCSPAFFERLVVDLLVKMGYGGTRKDAGERIGGVADGGIDGIIKEDRLGLDIVYVQAKRWDGMVGRPEIQKFAGALQGQRARKGIFITTSAFSQDALDYVSRIDAKIVLMDGDTLAQLMIDFNIGVATVDAYELKRIDSDYFTEDS